MATAGAPRRFCRCACFCSENLYVARYGLHVRFRGEQQLRRDYGPVSGRRRLCRDTGGRADGGGTLTPDVVCFARGLRSDDDNGFTSRCLSFLALNGGTSTSAARPPRGMGELAGVPR